MASKILPEILENILNNLHDFNGDFNETDIYSLRSCALVNWHWCKVSIPILWRDTFSYFQYHVYIPVYLSFLDEDEKAKLRESEIIVDHYPNALFNYPRFLKHLDLGSLIDTVRQYVNPPENNMKDTVNQLTSWLFSIGSQYVNPPDKDMKETVNRLTNLLLKLFIENGTILSKLDVTVTIYEFPIRSKIFHSLEQNGQFFSRLQEVLLYTDSGKFSYDIIMFLRSLTKFSTNIHTLKLREIHRYGRSSINYDPQTLDVLADLIRSQRKLRRLDLSYEDSFKGVISALKNQENSLQELILSGRYTQEYIALKDCETLKILRIKDREALPILKQLADGLCKLSALDIGDGVLTSSDIIPLIKKSGQILQRLRLVPSDENIPSQSLLLKTLMENCPNLIYFCISCVEFSNQLVEFIEGLQKLEILTLFCASVESEEVMKLRVIKFAKVLPSTLQYLEWNYLEWKKDSFFNSYSSSPISYIDVILNNCDVPLERLIFHNVNKEITDAVIAFCNRKKTLKYCCYMNGPEEEWIRLEEYVEVSPYKYVVVYC